MVKYLVNGRRVIHINNEEALLKAFYIKNIDLIKY